MSRLIVPKPVNLLRRLLVYVKPFRVILLLGLLANICYSGIDAGLTYLLRPFLDKSFIHPDLEFVKGIPLILLLGISVRGLVSAVGSYCMTSVARSVVNLLRQKVFQHILRLPADYYDEASSGQFLSKILYDVEQVAQVSADALTDFVQNICLIIGLLTVMMVICWQLSLLFLITIPFVGVMVNFTNKRVRRISHKIQHSMGQVTEIAAEAIDGYRDVRVFGGSDYEHQRFERATELSRSQDMKVAMAKAINVCSVQMIVAMGIALIILVAIQLSNVITVTAGSFLAVIAAMLQLIKPMKTLTSLHASIQRGLAGAESIFQMLDCPVERDQGTALLPSTPCSIRFDQVSYAYRQADPVLHNISFTIEAGETVALVGHSGSGKSTIASLLPRFYDVSSGAIYLNDVRIEDLSLVSLREGISIVSQQVTLFNDTIAANIAYGRFESSRADVMRAATLAYADEFIQDLPLGYDTQVGEDGVLLSGGQRQRLALARAILKDAPLLILDEATSALDNESERYIQIALEKVMQSRTTLIIAHRLSTIQRADRILVMHQGRIVEVGTHDFLLEQGGHYAQLYRMQSHVTESPHVQFAD
ncbi:MAG: lipid A export permease/ATP-binding protein MsbA [Gammaproteobacteria bacterium]|nr:lipid A export permease/ATP-binding protein MsbA [Gammaproteobacteria bacterium]